MIGGRLEGPGGIGPTLFRNGFRCWQPMLG